MAPTPPKADTKIEKQRERLVGRIVWQPSAQPVAEPFWERDKETFSSSVKDALGDLEPTVRRAGGEQGGGSVWPFGKRPASSKGAVQQKSSAQPTSQSAPPGAGQPGSETPKQ